MTTTLATLERADVEMSAFVEVRRLGLVGVEDAIARQQRREALAEIRNRYRSKSYEAVNDGEVVASGQSEAYAAGPFNTPHRSGRRPNRF